MPDSGRDSFRFCKRLVEHDAIDPWVRIIPHDTYPVRIQYPLEMKTQRLMKANRSGVFCVGDRFELSAASGDYKVSEVVIELLGKAEAAVRPTHGDEVNVAHRLRLRNKTQEICDDFFLVADDVGRISEFIDEDWVM
jgi:hypothetical protein